MKICQHGAEIFNKMCSFEISIGFYPSFQSSHQKNPCYRGLIKICKHGAEMFNKMCTFEESIEFLTPHFDCVIKKICKHGAEMFNKMCSFEESIEFLTPHFDCVIKRIPVIEVSGKFINMEPRYLTQCAVLK